MTREQEENAKKYVESHKVLRTELQDFNCGTTKCKIEVRHVRNKNSSIIELQYGNIIQIE